ncbi:MAG: GNAT family N-acetyltransferase [Saprospiraceae bacterium]|nr:GNAT family N-acetyltransferase [Saprospiraceae bacterium]
MFCAIIDFGTPEFDEALRLRDEILRKPLNLEFEADDIAKEYNEFHFGCYDEKNNELIGVMTLKPITDTVLKMRQFAVATNRQSRGVGSFLLTSGELFARQKGYKKIELHARSQAVPFYEKHAYTVEGKIFKEVNIDHLAMYKHF